MREKLIELLKEADRYEFETTKNSGVWDKEAAWGYIADSLIGNGVTIPVRCKDCENNRQCSIQDAMNWTPRTEIGIDPYCSYGERRNNMIFITKKQFEREMRERVEKELAKFFENQHKEDQNREIHNRINRMEIRLEKVEEMHGIPTNLEAKSFVI